MERNYPSKLLLFGEYTVTRGGSALVMPLQEKSGRWAWGIGVSDSASLVQWAQHLSDLQADGQLQCRLNLERFQADLDKGLHFASDIPIGYGMGSSGALCAALYDRYGLDKIDIEDTIGYPELKAALAQLEGFFHGASSGIDPLVSYLNRPLLLHADGSIEVVKLPKAPPVPLFLLDTGRSRVTRPLVEWYAEQCKMPEFETLVQEELVPAVRGAIDAFLQGEWENLSTKFETISRWQLSNLPPMIPAECRAIWQQGLDAGDYLLKLCGAGGGGYLLGWASSNKGTQKLSMKKALLPIAW